MGCFDKLNVYSFFDEPYKEMEINERNKFFNVLFEWDRRKHFIVFLKENNYIIN